MSKHVFFSILTFLMLATVPTLQAGFNTSYQPPFILNQEDTYLLLAHKWVSGTIFLDLNINGSFEGTVNNQTDLYGNWEISNNQKTLTLTNSPEDEDEFKLEYTLSNISFDSITLIDKKGKTIVLEIAD
ncbi:MULTISPECIES: hypothetical protein [unclassified Aureispira]|uniref:hypothetical protein n=1 Tax=unclassified Aureispira TaxID=2649989 RepID=UPI00069799C6|nr:MULTISPECIES: hypothetical protein [unclassified Aureispira]WMX14940.1 hypothetical protein QP953_00990 [Aureispira sp. CCB-E]